MLLLWSPSLCFFCGWYGGWPWVLASAYFLARPEACFPAAQELGLKAVVAQVRSVACQVATEFETVPAGTLKASSDRERPVVAGSLAAIDSAAVPVALAMGCPAAERNLAVRTCCSQ